MARLLFLRGTSAIAAALIFASCVASLPLQLQGGTNLMEEEYGPSQQELLRYLEDRESRNLADSGHPAFRQMRHGLDSSFSGIGESNRRLLSARRGALLNRGANQDDVDRFAKRNIDEIDRTAFDSFFKRNLDEIDRVGWSGFVKRLEDRQRYR